MATKAERMYTSLMEAFPAPGGEGAHIAFFKAGALGYRAKVPERQIIEDVFNNMPEGTRYVPDEEVITGVEKGFATALHAEIGGGNVEASTESQIPRDAFARLVTAGKGVAMSDIMARSPVPLDFPEEEAGWRTLDALYDPDEFLFIGPPRESGVLNRTVRTAGSWSKAFQKSASTDTIRTYNYIVPNPITGVAGPTKSDPTKTSFRADSAIAAWRYMVVEFDHVPLADQLAFWAVVKLPVAALTLSGGKSIHGWVQVDCSGVIEWEQGIEKDLFPGFLVPLGVDGSCKNEARLSRFPGQINAKTGAMQKLIYLAPGGKAVSK